MRKTAAALVVAVLAACKSSTAPVQKGPPLVDLRCSSASIGTDSIVTGGLDSAAACRRLDPVNGDTTYVRFYDLTLAAGHGYLVTMEMKSTPVQAILDLTTPDSVSPTLLAASRDRSGTAELAFVAPTSGTVRLHAGTLEGTAADTGAFTLIVHTCRVPVPPLAADTDSITHSDSTTSADCALNLTALAIGGDDNVSLVHLYQVHATSDTMQRLVTFTASAPVRVFFGGPHDDTFGQAPGSMMAYTDTATTHSAFYLAPGKAGDYTLVIGGDAPLTATVSYTLTIGPEIPHP